MLPGTLGRIENCRDFKMGHTPLQTVKGGTATATANPATQACLRVTGAAPICPLASSNKYTYFFKIQNNFLV